MIRLRNVFDDIAWVNDIWSQPVTTWTVNSYKLYDPDKYDLVPKEAYKKELAEVRKKEIANKKEQLKELEAEIKRLEDS